MSARGDHSPGNKLNKKRTPALPQLPRGGRAWLELILQWKWNMERGTQYAVPAARSQGAARGAPPLGG